MKIDLCTPTNWTADRYYIQDFCEWHFALGIDTIHLMDDLDGPSNNGRPLTEIPYVARKVKEGRINVIPEPGRRNWWDILPEFYAGHKDEFDWLCIFDSDEFLRLKKHKTIEEWLTDPELGLSRDCDAVQVAWRLYGDQGIVYRDPSGEPVSETFIKEPFDKTRIENKVVVRGGLRKPEFFIGHACADDGKYDRIKTASGVVRHKFDPFIDNPDYSVAELAHCRTKSASEFAVRRSLGRNDAPGWRFRKVFDEYLKGYYEINERTPEKAAIFDKALEMIKAKKFPSFEDFVEVKNPICPRPKITKVSQDAALAEEQPR